MPWIYRQNTGRIEHDGTLAGVGYSGRGRGKNNPSRQNEAMIGPIARGTWTIGAPFTHPHAGPYAMRLIPLPGTVTYRRSGFMIHGDSTAHPGAASDGCVIVNIVTRRCIWESGDHTIAVTL